LRAFVNAVTNIGCVKGWGFLESHCLSKDSAPLSASQNISEDNELRAVYGMCGCFLSHELPAGEMTNC
jgi:hypothetical protein